MENYYGGDKRRGIKGRYAMGSDHTLSIYCVILDQANVKLVLQIML